MWRSNAKSQIRPAFTRTDKTSYEENIPQLTSVGGYLTTAARRCFINRFRRSADDNLGLLDAVISQPGMKWVGTATEQGAGYVADGYATARRPRRDRHYVRRRRSFRDERHCCADGEPRPGGPRGRHSCTRPLVRMTAFGTTTTCPVWARAFQSHGGRGQRLETDLRAVCHQKNSPTTPCGLPCGSRSPCIEPHRPTWPTCQSYRPGAAAFHKRDAGR